MVTLKKKFTYLENGTIDLSAWLEKVAREYHLSEYDLIEKAATFANTETKGLTNFYGLPCIEQGLEIAEIILDLKLDQESVAAAILSGAIQHKKIPSEIITKNISEGVSKLLQGIYQMNALSEINAKTKLRNPIQIDRLRKLLLAMVSDIRVVLIKLAERTSLMRGIKKINSTERAVFAQETLDLYAPLANRLGIGKIKWELEDFAFRYLDPNTYKTIAHHLAERREDREERIHAIITHIKEKLLHANIHAEVTGRPKHIYSIYLKMQRKNLSHKNIYDYSAVRVLVPTLDDCYTALSLVHQLYEHIPEEFDDYIMNPKLNGYRSVHTAVLDQDGKAFEIQIRTSNMHEEAEHGVAAHWIYKENKKNEDGYETKITYLRQLLDWHKDLATKESLPPLTHDHIYAFTPMGDILELPIGATPLDFAYHIHSGLGHRCRGAKINGHIVALSHALQTGDKVDIMTVPQGAPSRDWLNPQLGYLKTSRARAKVAQYFRSQDNAEDIEAGKKLLEKELSREKIQAFDLHKIAARLHFKTPESLLLSLGKGSVRPSQITHLLHEEHKPTKAVETSFHGKKPEGTSHLRISGMSDLLTRVAKCCKPIPGDKILGYITQGRGISIHKYQCTQFITKHQFCFCCNFSDAIARRRIDACCY